MKKWQNPDMWILGAERTAAGGDGGGADGVVYQVDTEWGKFQLIGTSGEALPLPTVP